MPPLKPQEIRDALIASIQQDIVQLSRDFVAFKESGILHSKRIRDLIQMATPILTSSAMDFVLNQISYAAVRQVAACK